MAKVLPILIKCQNVTKYFCEGDLLYRKIVILVYKLKKYHNKSESATSSSWKL